jgi:hypothetical protein
MGGAPRYLNSRYEQQQSSQTNIDPRLAARQDYVWNQAVNLNSPYQPYTGQRYQGFNADQNAGFDAVRGAANAGMSEVGAGADATRGLLNFSAPQVNAGAAGSFQSGPAGQVNFGFGSGYMPQEFQASSVGAERGPGGYKAYMNPYTQDVVDASLGDIEKSRREAIGATRSQAAGARAFGNSRAGVAEALTNREFADTAARTASGLRERGFNTSLGFNQGDQDRALQAGMGSLQAHTQAGLGNLNARTTAGLAGQSDALRAGMYNASARDQMGMFNAGQQQQGAQFDAGAAQRASEANASNALAGGNLRLGAAGQMGALGGQMQNMGLTGAAAITGIGNQQQAWNQQQNDFDFQQWQAAQARPYENIGFMSGILGGQQYGSSTSGQGSGSSRQTNPDYEVPLIEIGSQRPQQPNVNAQQAPPSPGYGGYPNFQYQPYQPNWWGY